MKLKKSRITKTAQEKELKLLKRKCLQLWTAKVKALAGGKCEYCGKKTRLNAHHIESYTLNKALRYDTLNGVGLCPTHHRFGRESAHHSFCFMVRLMEKRPIALEYLMNHYKDKMDITKEFLLKTIKEFEH